MTTSGKRQVYVVGPNQLQNELLAYFIRNDFGADCRVAAVLSDVPAREPDSPDEKRLILYDFSGSSETLESLMAADESNLLLTDYLVLMNVSNTLTIEIEALQCGVRGFLYYQGGLDILVKMIHAVLNSELWISRGMISELLLIDTLRKKSEPPAKRMNLSPREIQILKAMSKGLTNAKIAQSYCLSPHTVKTHIHHILRKLNVSNRLQAAQWASTHM
jgi:DNA-binding NarL/FixJ family response regulator